MATQTPNLELKKPEKTDFYNVDDFNYNAEIIDNEIHGLKAKVVGENTEGEWKRVTIVIPELQFIYYSGGHAPTGTSASFVLDDYISDNIQDAIIVSVLAQERTYIAAYKHYDIGCSYCAKHPDGKWGVTLYDNRVTTENFTAFTVIDVLYKSE